MFRQGNDEFSRWHLYCLGVLIALGGVVRFAYIDSHSVWIDEYITLERAVLPSDDLVKSLFLQGPGDQAPDYSPPLYHLILGFFLKFGHGDTIARLPGILFSVLTIPLLFGLTRLLFSSRVGLYAASIYSVSLYMVHYGRNIRPYGVVLFFILLGLYSCCMAMQTGKYKYWWFYLVSSVCSMYMLLTAVGNMAGCGLAVLFHSTLLWASSREKALKNVIAFGVFTLAAFLFYIPWVPAHMLVVKLSGYDFPPTGVSSFTWPGFVSAFNEFAGYFNPSPVLRGTTLVLFLLGLVNVVARRRFLSFVYLASWAFFPALLFMVMDTSYPFFSRRIVTVYFFVVIVVAFGLDFVSSCIARFSNIAANVVAVAILLVYMSLNLTFLPVFYASRLSEYKDEMVNLFLSRGNSEYFYTSDKIIDFMRTWYLPEVFKSLSDSHGRQYKRVVLGASGSQIASLESDGIRVADFSGFQVDRRYSVLGIVNRSPLLVYPGSDGVFQYGDSFRSLRIFQDAAAWDNVAVVPSGALVPRSRGRDAFVTYVFESLGQDSPSSLSVDVSSVVDRFLDQQTEDELRVWLTQDDGPDVLLGVVSGADFQGFPSGDKALPLYSQARTVKKFSTPFSGVEKVAVKVEFRSGLARSMLSLASLDVRFEYEKLTPPLPAYTIEELKRIYKNTKLSRWDGGVTPAFGNTLFPFSVTQSTDDLEWLGTPEERRAFLAAHPGLEPVYSVGLHGKVDYELFDPYLIQDFITVGNASVRKYTLYGYPNSYSDYTVSGKVHFPVVDINGVQFEFPWNFPAGTSTTISGDGDSNAVFRPLFSKELFDRDQFFASSDIALNSRDNCIQCSGPGNCFATYFFHTRLPLKSLRFSYHPRLFNDLDGVNRVSVSVSSDGVEYTLVDDVRSDRSGIWLEMGMQRTVVVPLAKPGLKVWVRFDMSNDGCQIYSSPQYPLVFFADIDSTSLKPITFGDQLEIRSFQALDNDFSLKLSNQKKFPRGLVRPF